MNSSNQDSISILKCARCETKDSKLTSFKYDIPICLNCRKKFKIWQIGNRIAILLISLFSIALGATLFLLMAFSMSPEGSGGKRKELFGWFQIALPITVVLMVFVVLLFVLRHRLGSNPKKYIMIDSKMIFIKTENETEWEPYEEWVDKVMQESDFGDQEIDQIIKKKKEIQETIRKSNQKKGNISLVFGILFLIFGIAGVIYGAAVSLPIGFPHGTTVFFTLHLPSSLPFVIIGIGLIIYGIKKRK